ncbi:DNA internalization-related competence protein ComEC/Rec2 [Variovorax sp. dw_954]|uniref:DNA internalization-related competence protein ComEC/Rec2 n=1 Tax=Variovorax sp. dw_954 TaxID=2720078 RepID=UPI002117248F|nr:DNA internalization-related competence protein ComEC/Rec2 [Variovorax sp. dw_954]
MEAVGEEQDTGQRRPWAFAAMAGSVLGAALQLQQRELWALAVYAAMALAALFALWVLQRLRHRGARATGLLALLLGAALAFGLAGTRAVLYADGALDPDIEGRDVEVVGVVAQMPQRGEGALRFRLDVESARWVGREAPSTGPAGWPTKLALGWYAENTGLWGRPVRDENQAPAPSMPAELHAGERWRMTVRLRAPHGNLNPHGFDYELLMWEQGVRAAGYVRAGSNDAPPMRLGMTWQHPVERAREWVRDAVFERVADKRSAGVIAALITGDQSAIDRADWDIFRATGVAHLMSISGLHITMFAWLAAALVGALWRRSTRCMLLWPAPQVALVGGVLLAALYALFSGWGVPSQRTVSMLATLALLRLTGRRWPAPNLWLCTCAVVVALDPWALTQAGFWLSFVAVGVLFATDAGESPAGRTSFVARLLRMLREQWVVTLALAPLTLLLFQQVSLVGLLANTFAIPWVTLVVTPLAMLGVAIPPLWDVAAWTVQGLGDFLQWLAAWPLATVSTGAPPAWLALCGVAGGVLLAMRLPLAMRALGLPLLLSALLWQPGRPEPGEFDLLAADIGQGNAVLVRTAHHALLYDTGPRYSLESDAGQRVLVPLLRALDVRLDTVVLSHRDADHTGGAPAVLATQPQAALRSSIEEMHPLQELRRSDKCVAGQHWEWDGVRFEFLHPVAADYESATKPNAISCVLRIDNGRASALLAGDIERDQESALVKRDPGLRADVLLAPHHGSKTSSSALLLDTLKPRIALVQAGYRNRFGHPADEVTKRYEARGIAVVDSPHCGAIAWQSTSPAAWECERAVARRYWRHVPR